MPIIKCKMCGGDIELTADKTFGTCEYCGSTMTLPKVSDDQRAAAFNRGNHFRRMGEFDKALGVYERIVAEDDTDAEAHWCCALSRFGIEYVEDPATYEWLPTCHRASFDSFLEDVDYLAAVEHSDGITRRQYQKDAAKIAEVQRGILATSQNTEPYDVFISYKELDESGERTRDSILAQEIYYRLTEKGWRVFFSRITLEDVPGTQYEPYIFAALNSAKVMIVVGTSAENLNAVWVKNEWSRFLAMMRKDKTKLLIPCYRDMDPYDLPEQLAVLMSYDMGKIGFIQDLIRGVDKVLSAEKKPEPAKETVVVQQGGGPNVTALLKRGQQALEDGEWDKAREFYDQVLNMDAENAEAFLGLFLAGAKCADESVYISRAANQQGRTEQLSIAPATDRIRTAVKANIVPGYLDEPEIRKLFDFDLSYPSTVAGQNAVSQQEKNQIETNRNLNRAFQYASGSVLERLNTFKARLFSGLDKRAETAKTQVETARKATADAYEKHLAGAEAKAIALRQKAEEKREADYQTACEAQNRADSAYRYLSVINDFRKIEDYKDSAERIGQCEASIRELEEQERLRKEAEAKAAAERAEAERKKKEAEAKAAAEEAERRRILAKKAAAEKKEKQKKINIIAGIVAAVAIAAILIVTKVIIPGNQYKEAEAILNDGDRVHAAMTFATIGGYKDSHERSLTLWSEITQRDSIAAGLHHTVGVKSDSTVVATKFTGDNYVGQCDVSEWTGIVAVAAGYNHTVGLKADGTVVATKYTGSYYAGQCDVSSWMDIVAIAAGSNHTVGLKADGTVVATKYTGDQENYHGQCEVSDWTDIVAIAARSDYTVGLKADGTVVATKYTGDQQYYCGQCDVSDWTDIVAIAAGFDHTVGLKENGTVVATEYTGAYYDGQCDVSGWTDIVAIAAGSNHTVGLKADGSTVAVGEKGNGQCDVYGWTNIAAIAAGSNHTVGLKANGCVVATEYATKYIWEHDDGQCDVSGWSEIKLPNK